MIRGRGPMERENLVSRNPCYRARVGVTVPSPSTRPAMHAAKTFDKVFTSRGMNAFSASGAPPSRHHAGKAASLVEAAGQLFHPFRDGLDYAFILHRPKAMGRMRGVLSAARATDPGAGPGARALRPVHESLQGRASWPRPTPRRCHVAVADDEGFTE